MRAHEQRWPVGGYAPGGYYCKCISCADQFTGDKRAIHCLPCAVEASGYRVVPLADLEAAERERDALREALEPFVAAFEKRRTAYIRRYSDPAIGRTNFDKMPDKWPMEKIEFSMGVFRRARTLLNKEGEK